MKRLRAAAASIESATEFVPLLLVGFVLSSVVLAATAEQGALGRDLKAEIGTLATVYPVILAWTIAHLRRRTPELVKPLLAWFLIAFVVRLVVLCWVTGFAANIRPYSEGAWNDDTWWYTMTSRFYLKYFTGRDYGLSAMLFQPEAMSRLTGMEVTGGLPNFTLIWSLLIYLNGYAMLAYLVPWAMLGSFWMVQFYVFLRRATTPTVARMMLPLLVLAPDFVLPATSCSKDVLMGILVIYWAELSDLEGPSDGRWWLAAVAVGLGVFLVRVELWLLVAAALCSVWICRRLTVPQRRIYAAVAAAAVWYAASRLPVPSGSMSSLLAVNWLGDLFVVPMLYWLASANIQTALSFAGVALQAVVWPFVAGLVVMSALLTARGRRVASTAFWIVLLLYHTAGATQASLNMTAVRYRLAITPWLMALALAAAHQVREEPARTRWRFYLLGVVWVAGMLLLNLVGSRLMFVWN